MRSILQAIGDDVEFDLGVGQQIGALEQVLAQQPVGALAAATLTGLFMSQK
jgi:hypothetical protein